MNCRRWVSSLYALAFCTALGTALPAAAHAPDSKPLPPDAKVPALDQTQALSASRAAVGRSIGDFTLLDRSGRPVRLDAYRGKPLLVSFIYTGCFQVCPTNTRALKEALSVVQDRVGRNQFNVLSIGFNQPADSPQALKSFAAQHGIRDTNWEFLSPPSAIVPALTREFGFSFVATPAGFDHTLQVSVVDAQGRIYRQVYGETYAADSLIAPLLQLVGGAPVADDTSVAALVERVRILCSVYDPATGQYRLRYGLVFEIAGGLTFLLWIIWFFLNEWLLRRRALRSSRGEPA